MKINLLFSTLTFQFLSCLALPAVAVDMSQFYDEQDNQKNAVDGAVTNYAGGYSQFVADVDNAYQQDRGGVIDEWVPYTTNATISISGNPFSSGIGSTGIYNVGDPSATVGNYITFAVENSDWEITNQKVSGAISISDRFAAGVGGDMMILNPKSQGTKIITTLNTSDLISAIGFTLLAKTGDDVTAIAYFSDNSFYTETINVGKDIFFGAEAPTGESVVFFVLTTANGGSVFLDDIGVITTIPEPSVVWFLGCVGIGLFKRRR